MVHANPWKSGWLRSSLVKVSPSSCGTRTVYRNVSGRILRRLNLFNTFSTYPSTNQPANSGGTILPAKLIVPHLVKKFPAFYGTEFSWPCSPLSGFCPYPDLHEPRPRLPLYFNIIFPCTSKSSKFWETSRKEISLRFPRTVPFSSALYPFQYLFRFYFKIVFPCTSAFGKWPPPWWFWGQIFLQFLLIPEYTFSSSLL